MNAVTADRYLLNLGSLGEWVSGVGALGAVMTAVWLADKQRRDDVEKLEISCFYSIVEQKKVYTLIIASCGSRASKPTHLRVASDYTDDFLHFPEMQSYGDQLPKLLNYAEEAMLFLPDNAMQQILEFVENSCASNTKSLRFEVMTTLGLFKLAVPKSLIGREP
jgi:hypothetical protein